jgi:hypothetical protein
MNTKLLALPLVLATACNSGDAPLTGAELTGSWSSPVCEAYDNGMGGKNYLTRDFTLTATTWRLDLGLFGDDACTVPLFSAEIEGPYTLGALSTKVPGATEGNFSYDSLVWTAQTADIAALFTSSDCGADPWEVGVPQDVSVTGCIGVAKPIADCPTDHDVVAIEDGQLFFGERITDMCKPEGRPAALVAYGLDKE